jgi:SHS family lactate transporter-like MFS transporter
MDKATNSSASHVRNDELSSHDMSSTYEDSSKHVSFAQYLSTRLPTLRPPMHKTDNPFKLLASLSRQQWLFFLVGWLGWTFDAFDFFTVSLTVTNLAQSFGKSNAEITWGITLVLMFRSVGSTIFGIASDRYGRKWYANIDLRCTLI